MDICVFFWVLGIILLIVEYWFLTHLYKEAGSYSKGYHYERIGFKVLHLLLLVVLNIIPVVNVIGFILILCIPMVEEDIYFNLIPPDKEGEETKISKLDKLLNKKL